MEAGDDGHGDGRIVDDRQPALEVEVWVMEVEHVSREEDDDGKNLDEGIQFSGDRWRESAPSGCESNDDGSDDNKDVPTNDRGGEPEGKRWEQ